MSIQKSQTKGDTQFFNGNHFESSGDVLSALLGDEFDVTDTLKLIIPDFKLADAYQAEPLLSHIYPNNHHIKDKIRQVLQCLRNKGLIAFDSRGNYRALWKK